MDINSQSTLLPESDAVQPHTCKHTCACVHVSVGMCHVAFNVSETYQ